MCGLIFLTSRDLVTDENWKRGLDSLAPRGPDASGELAVDGMAFGHRRLAIIGLGETGRQPLNSDPNHVLVYNGEIYNYRELGRELGLDAVSDTQVLYEIARRGDWDRWLPRIRGMYAFVHYSRLTHSVTTARDPFGIKPLYVRCFDSGELAIASTVSALFALSAKGLQIDRRALSGFLAIGLFPAGTTPFEQISKVAPGTLTVWQRTVQGWKHTNQAIARTGWPMRSVGDALEDSVKVHLTADVPVGLLLSGGVDSTPIAALAARETEDLMTFCLTNPEDPRIDESAFARHNAALLGTRHLEVPVNPGMLVSQAAMLIASAGEPFSDPAFLPLSVLSRHVGAEVKVALAGEGADELFGGYRRNEVEMLLDSRFIGSALRRSARALRLDRRIASPTTQAQRVLRAAAYPEPADRHAVLMFGSWDLVRRVCEEGEAAYHDFLERWAAYPADDWALGQPANRAYDTREWLTDVFLEKSDRASMVHGLELRTPFLDPVVASSVPDPNPRRSSKAPLRRELERLLPGVALPSVKKGLGVNVPDVMGGRLTSLASDFVWDQGSAFFGMGSLHRQLLADAVESFPQLAFRTAMLAIWWEQFKT